jgi:enoyl-CoA hydratase/carnithine racemase
MPEQPVLVTREGAIATITLNRPDVLNAINDALADALDAALDAQRDATVIIFTGAGERAFCGGADTTALLSFSPAERQRWIQRLWGLIWRVQTLPQPTIAAVNGHAIAGGAMLVAACDLRIAVERATFQFPGANYGLAVGAFQLPALIGANHARDLLLTGRRIVAREAEQMGLVNRTVADLYSLRSAVAELAATLAANSPSGMALIKRVLARADDGLDAAYAAEVLGNLPQGASEDFVRRMAAIVAERERRSQVRG